MDLEAIDVCFNSIDIFLPLVSICNFNFNRNFSSPNCHSKSRQVGKVREIVLDSNLVFSDMNDLGQSI
jgi:hypothetical protein